MKVLLDQQVSIFVILSQLHFFLLLNSCKFLIQLFIRLSLNL